MYLAIGRHRDVRVVVPPLFRVLGRSCGMEGARALHQFWTVSHRIHPVLPPGQCCRRDWLLLSRRSDVLAHASTSGTHSIFACEQQMKKLLQLHRGAANVSLARIIGLLLSILLEQKGLRE
jgi:hypothetical protein